MHMFIFNFANNVSFVSLVKACLALILSWTSLRGKILAPNCTVSKASDLPLRFASFVLYMTTFFFPHKENIEP